MVQPLSFKRYRFPAEVVRYAVWLYFRFSFSLRDVEELLAEREIAVSREAIRCWVNKFGPLIAANLRRRRPSPTGRWHLDEMVVKIGGQRMWLAGGRRRRRGHGHARPETPQQTGRSEAAPAVAETPGRAP